MMAVTTTQHRLQAGMKSTLETLLSVIGLADVREVVDEDEAFSMAKPTLVCLRYMADVSQEPEGGRRAPQSFRHRWDVILFATSFSGGLVGATQTRGVFEMRAAILRPADCPWGQPGIRDTAIDGDALGGVYVIYRGGRGLSPPPHIPRGGPVAWAMTFETEQNLEE